MLPAVEAPGPGGGRPALELSQAVFDTYVGDIDRALREIGIGDTTIPKRKKRMIATFYTMVAKLDPLIAVNSGKLCRALDEILFENGNPDGAKSVAGYVNRVASALDEQSVEKICSGRINWPAISDPA